MNKIENIIKKYSEKVSYEEYLLVLKSSKRYYLEQSKKCNSYAEDKLHPFLMNTFIAFKRRGITDKEWQTLDNEVKKMVLKGAI